MSSTTVEIPPKRTPSTSSETCEGGDDSTGCTRRPLLPQSSVHEYEHHETEYGCAVVEKTKHFQMWSNIVNKSMVGTGTCSSAALTTLEGNIYANSENFFPTRAQIDVIVNAIQHSGKGNLAETGINLGDQSFMYNKTDLDKGGVYGIAKDGDGGCVVIKTKRLLMIGIYDKDRETSINTIEELAKYIVAQGF